MIVLYGAAVLVVLSGVVAMSLHKFANRPVWEIIFRRLSSDVSRSWKFSYIVICNATRMAHALCAFFNPVFGVFVIRRLNDMI